MSDSNSKAAPFVTTHWTKVLSARGDSPEARMALSELCAAYYDPVLAFITRSVPDRENALDLTQEFFTRLLSSQGLKSLEQGKGRFRSFLLGAVKHFLADMRDRDARLKRGGGRQIEPLESEDGPTEWIDPTSPSPDREFDRKWALTVLDRALGKLAREHEEAGKAPQFEALKPWLTGDDNSSQAAIAAQLGLSEGTVKVAIHRLRRRFRILLKAEVADTIEDPAEASTELNILLQALLPENSNKVVPGSPRKHETNSQNGG